jgi:hypothetical protein
MLTFFMSTLSGQNQIKKKQKLKHQFVHLHDESKIIVWHTKLVDS